MMGGITVLTFCDGGHLVRQEAREEEGPILPFYDNFRIITNYSLLRTALIPSEDRTLLPSHQALLIYLVALRIELRGILPLNYTPSSSYFILIVLLNCFEPVILLSQLVECLELGSASEQKTYHWVPQTHALLLYCKSLFQCNGSQLCVLVPLPKGYRKQSWCLSLGMTKGKVCAKCKSVRQEFFLLLTIVLYYKSTLQLPLTLSYKYVGE